MGKLISEELHHQCHPHTEIKLQKPTYKKSMRKKPMKITYISSPVLVRAATASEFRALVQELTGKDSDVDGVLSPRGGEELGPAFIRESGLTEDAPASARGGWTSDLPAQWHSPSYQTSTYSLYMEEAFDFSNNSEAVHGFGFDEPFLFSEASEGFAGFQPSQCFSMIKELV